jgi:tetratricopeptide (TPR) repeat protein
MIQSSLAGLVAFLKVFPARVRQSTVGRGEHARVPNPCWATVTRPCRDFSRLLKVCLVLLIFVVLALAAGAAMPSWIQNIEVRTLLESAIFRTVPLPGGPVTIRRPPAETVPAITELIKTQPHPEELYSLRAMEEEQKLDFTSAEADWKLYLQRSSDKAAAELALADFYHRRHRPLDEVNALSALGRLPNSPSDERTAITDQPSWQAFERALQVIHAQALGKVAAMQQYQAWITRYPEEADIHARYFEYLVAARDFKAAESVVANYSSKFPKDEIFPVRAQALLAYKQGSAEKALGIYDKNFKPLWPNELVKNYFELLTTTDSLGRFLERARAALLQDPNDLDAVCRIFFYYEQKGNIEGAQQAVTEYRLRKDSRKAAWTPQELYTLATLLHDAKIYPEAARYYFALYNSQEVPHAQKADVQRKDVQENDAQEKALAGLTTILLDAPEQQVSFGAADLSMYSDIATMDTGPGYLNGILSLILNTTSPDTQYAEEERRAVPYFHRARAAQLIALLGQKFPNSIARPPLHAKLIESYAGYGAQDAVIRLGREFLAAFPEAGQREQVALLMADAYAAKGNTTEEFAMYDFLLKELARKAGGVPLGEKVAGIAPEPHLVVQHDEDRNQAENDDMEKDSSDDSNREDTAEGAESDLKSEGGALSVHKREGTPAPAARSAQYASVLNRYLSRLALNHAVPQALAVLRQELQRNPNDPGLYEQLAQFLEQNELGTEQEAIYRRALQQFPGKGWYHKMGRWYVRTHRDRELGLLITEVTKIFSGTELEDYFLKVVMPSDFTVQLNLCANARFPHNLTFVRNLLIYHQAHLHDAAWEALIRQHWFEDATLRSQFFEYLSRTGKLESELAELKLNEHGRPGEWMSVAEANPAAVRFAAEAELWRSHFEDGAPALGALAALYPAEPSLGREASSVYRSLAYFNPGNTGRAVQIELNLLAADPQNRDTLARIGDIYSDRGLFKKAAPYWNRMPATEPGNSRSYEMAATVFWDYYFFHDALRLLNQGRTKLGNSSLYSYEAGAIYEASRDYPKAVEEYIQGAVHEGGDSSSHKRLLQLANRRSTANLVDAATLKAATQSGYGLETVRLRADVLTAQSKEEEAAAFLNSVLDRTASPKVAEGIEQMAEEKSLKAVHRHALEREVALNRDSIGRLQLRYELAHFCEDTNDLVCAERNIDSIHRENPRIMGVVRATVDFYWRNKKQQRAIDILMQAAKDSHHELAAKFTYEAARKMTDARQYEPARKLLTVLLQESPYDNEYAAAVADTYLRHGDNAGLRDFYLKRIAFFRTAAIPKEKRQSEIASFRRALIPQLTALKDYAGAVDQYIEIINAYPDDENLSSEAALYALRHGRKDQLVNFYSKTVVASPQDSRWVVVLARLQTVSEDYEAAIQTFSHAIKIRPDRADLLSARATLEERLMRFDEAAVDYATLYERTYHDSQWMEKVAEIRARQNQPELTVQALRVALVEGRPEWPEKYFAVAGRLERWGMLSLAREFAEHGIAVAGNDLLAASENHSGAELYVRIMTRMRMQDTAWQTVETAVKAAHQLPPLQEQVEKKGLEAITDREWRESILRTRQRVAREGMAKCMRSMGSVVNLYFTPEEKQAFLLVAENKNAVIARDDAYDYLVPLAQEAGLAGFQASLMYESLRTKPNPVSLLNEFVELQVRRLKLAELGRQLEEIAKRPEQDMSIQSLHQAANIYHLANQPLDELRVLKAVERRPNYSAFSSHQQARFFELLLKHEPQELLERAKRTDKAGDDSANFILAHTDMKMARAAINARSAAEDAVWRPAYIGLAGLYFRDTSPEIRAAFLQTLSDQSIGQRIKHPGDRTEELAGDVWFYYGSRYGEYLGITRRGDPEDWLPAQLEYAPAQSGAYFNSALYYEEMGDTPHAIEDYQHALELSSKRVDAHDNLAEIYWNQKRRDAALSEWRQSLDALKGQVSPKSYDLPDSYWDDYSSISRHLASHGLLAQFRSQLNGLLHAYVKHSGSYRLLPILRSSLSDPNDPKEATTLVLELSRDSADQLDFLGSFAQSNPNRKLHLQMESLYRRILELAHENLKKKETGYEREYAQTTLREWQMKWLEYLLNGKQYDRLRSEMAPLVKTLSQNKKDNEDEQDNRDGLIQIQLRLAAATNGLDGLLQSFYDSEAPPTLKVLKETARVLQKAGDRQSARRILEFVFRCEVENHNLDAANMLALAEIRIEAGELQSAVALLRRMTLVAGAPFETQAPAAALLTRTGHAQEAISFLKELVNATPWNAGYRASLAQAQIGANVDAVSARRALASVAADKAAPYEVRVSGAKALKRTDAIPELGSRELKLLTSGKPLTVEESNHPFFWAARVQISENQVSANPASEKLAPATQAQLLRAALEDYPHGDSVRPSLLRAAMRAGDYYLAIASVKPLVQSYWPEISEYNPRYGSNHWLNEDQEDDSDTGPDTDTDSPLGLTSDDTGAEDQAPTAFENLPAAQKAEVIREIGMAFEKLGELPEALPQFREASRLEPATAKKKQIDQEMRRIRAILDRSTENNGRQPQIHEALEQNNVVRPRLTAATPVRQRAAMQGVHP